MTRGGWKLGRVIGVGALAAIIGMAMLPTGASAAEPSSGAGSGFASD